MMEFSLPVLESGTLIGDAFEPMVDLGTSGLVSWDVGQVRLIRFEHLEDALSSGVDTLAGVPRWDAASVMIGAQTATVVQELMRLGLDYGVFSRSGHIARVVSVHEPLAGIYLNASRGAKCLNSVKAHYYPPHQRNPRTPRVCVVCGFPVP
jgi:hypothetical protein